MVLQSLQAVALGESSAGVQETAAEAERTKKKGGGSCVGQGAAH